MTTVEGNAYQTTNVRSVPKVADNIVGKLYNGNTFTGTTVSVGAEVWIRLNTVNGKPVTGEQYVASWVVNSKVVTDTTPPAEDDPIVGANVIYASGKVVPLVPKP